MFSVSEVRLIVQACAGRATEVGLELEACLDVYDAVGRGNAFAIRRALMRYVEIVDVITVLESKKAH